MWNDPAGTVIVSGLSMEPPSTLLPGPIKPSNLSEKKLANSYINLHSCVCSLQRIKEKKQKMLPKNRINLTFTLLKHIAVNGIVSLICTLN